MTRGHVQLAQFNFRTRRLRPRIVYSIRSSEQSSIAETSLCSTGSLQASGTSIPHLTQPSDRYLIPYTCMYSQSTVQHSPVGSCRSTRHSKPTLFVHEKWSRLHERHTTSRHHLLVALGFLDLVKTLQGERFGFPTRPTLKATPLRAVCRPNRLPMSTRIRSMVTGVSARGGTVGSSDLSLIMICRRESHGPDHQHFVLTSPRTPISSRKPRREAEELIRLAQGL